MATLSTDQRANNLNLYIDQGADFSQILTVYGIDSTAVNLTGCTVSATMRLYHGTTTDFNLSAEVYGDPTQGKIRVFMTAANSSLLKNLSYVYSVKIESTIKVIAFVGNVYVTQST